MRAGAPIRTVAGMTTIASPRSTQLLEEVRALAAQAAARAAEIEAIGRVPRDFVDELAAAGCFRVLLPRSNGGAESTLAEALAVFEMLAAGDASTGWTVMIGASGWTDLAALPRATFDALFPASDDVIVAGAFAPSGSIVPVGDAYRLTGRWGFASGCQHATLFYANAVEGFADGHPRLRISVLTPDEITIEPTWDVAGLRGTGSHHFSVNGVVVAADRTFVPLVDPPCVDLPIARIPTPAVFALGIAAVALGAARGGLDDVAALAHEKVPLLAPGALAFDPLFHHGLARASTGLAAARSLVFEVATELWEHARDDTVTLELRASARAAAAWAVDAALAAAEFAYRAGGGGALYSSSTLQRRLRDVHAMTQHFLVRPDTFAAVGAVLAGRGLSVPVF